MNAKFSRKRAVRLISVAAAAIMLFGLLPAGASAEVLQLTCSDGTDFGVEDYGYTQPAARTVTIKNTGGTALTNVNITKILPSDYDQFFSVDSSALPAASLESGMSCAVTVQPLPNLPAGIYEMTVIFGADELDPGEYESVTFNFEVASDDLKVFTVGIEYIAEIAAPGTSIQINAYVSRTPGTPKGVTYSVAKPNGDPADPGTIISDSGLLTVGADEKSAFLLVTAVSVFNSEIETTQIILTTHDAGNLGRISTDQDLKLAFPAYWEGNEPRIITLNGHDLVLDFDYENPTIAIILKGYPGYEGDIGIGSFDESSSCWIITLYKDFLQGLPNGEYHVKIGFYDVEMQTDAGSGEGIFTIAADNEDDQPSDEDDRTDEEDDGRQTDTSDNDSPKTGDNNFMRMSAAVMFVSAAGILSAGFYGRKREVNKQ